MVARLVVGEADRGQRLDRFVQRGLAGDAPASRAEVQRWIDAGAVVVNGTPRKAKDEVRVGDVVVVTRALPPKTAATPEEGVAFEVVYVDDALVVVNKPAGLVVHPAKSHTGGTLVNGLLARGYFDAELTDARDPAGHTRPGIVHRIDKGTSGLLVVARTSRAREGLATQFAAHTIAREYEAIALGDVRVLEHDTPYGRHPKDRMRFTTHLGPDAKRAVTRVEVVTRYKGATRVRCTLRTGRTHQIRVHLAETGTPVLGDTLYGRLPRDPLLADLWRGLGHQALHARLLGFIHPITGKSVRFEAPLPDDMEDALRRLAAAS